jgi:hypothetical protein
MNIGDLIAGLKDKAVGMMTPDAAPSPTTQNLAQLQSQYQMYVVDSQSRGQQPLPFKDWVIQQQLQRQ